MSPFTSKHLNIIAQALHRDEKQWKAIAENENSSSEEIYNAQGFLMLISEVFAIVRDEYETERRGTTNIMPFDELFPD